MGIVEGMVHGTGISNVVFHGPVYRPDDLVCYAITMDAQKIYSTEHGFAYGFGYGYGFAEQQG